MRDDPIYLDYNATTPASPDVMRAMIPWMVRPTNASSAHVLGRQARAALDESRDRLAEATGVAASKILYTSGATESNNLVIADAAANRGPRNRVLVLATEHKAVLEPLVRLERSGWEVSVVPVLRSGLIDAAALSELLDQRVALCCIQLANNETGVIQPLKAIAERAHSVGALVHTDATQALGKIPVDLADLDVDFASFSSHKIYGPQGIGALFVRAPKTFTPSWSGGTQERGLRPGTENVAGAVGFGVAALACSREMRQFAEQADRQTQLLKDELLRAVPTIEAVVPTDTPRLANTLSVRLVGADAEAVVAHTPGVAFSTGSACTSMVPGPSHVLTAMLHDSQAASECIRLSTGRPTTDGEILEAVRQLAASVDTVLRLAS